MVTGSSPINEDSLKISYDFYWPGDDDKMEKGFSGEVQIQYIGEGIFHYVRNEII